MEKFDKQLSNLFKDSQKVTLGFWEKQSLGFRVMGGVFGNWAAAGLLVPQKAVALAGITLLLAGGGSALAMEKALPGDLLYGPKVAVYHAIGLMTKASAEARANWAIKEIKRINREMEKLEFKGELNEEVEVEAEASVEANLGDFYEAKEEIVEKKGVEAGAKLELKLESKNKGQEKKEEKREEKEEVIELPEVKLEL